MEFEHLSVRALRTHQGDEIDVYAFFIRGADILKIADISRIHRDEQAQLKGFQRREVQRHVKGIVDYLDKGEVLFPNAIILAFSPEVEFRQSRGPTPEGLSEVANIGTLTIPIHTDGRRAAWVVDGQQRSLALSRSENQDIAVPVIGFVAADLETQRQQFILVNKAKPLPVRLINELLPEIGADLPADLSPRKIPSELCNLLNTDPKSPFYQMIKRESDDEARAGAVVQDSALIKVMEHSIQNYGALSLFKNTAAGRSDIDAMYRVMCTYWGAVREVFPEAWGKPPHESRLMHSAGIRAMGVLMDRMMPRVYRSQDPAKEVRSALERIAPHCCWTEGTWEGIGLEWNAVQAVHRHIKLLAEYLVQLDFAASQEAA